MFTASPGSRSLAANCHRLVKLLSRQAGIRILQHHEKDSESFLSLRTDCYDKWQLAASCSCSRSSSCSSSFSRSVYFLHLVVSITVCLQSFTMTAFVTQSFQLCLSVCLSVCLSARAHSVLVAPLCGLLHLRIELVSRCPGFVVKCLKCLVPIKL